jgi:hypothetical protein
VRQYPSKCPELSRHRIVRTGGKFNRLHQPAPTAGQLCNVVCLNEAAEMTLHSIKMDNTVPDNMAWAIAVMGMFVTS